MSTPTAADALRTLIVQKRDELVTLERALDIVAPAAAAPVTLPFTFAARPARTPRPKHAAAPTPDAGLQARVLDVLRKARKPLRGREVCAALKSDREEHVILTLRALAARNEVIKTGATSTLRYSAPEFVTDAAE